MTQQIIDFSRVNEKQKSQIKNIHNSQKSKSKFSRQLQRYFDQIDSQYLKYCLTQQLIDILQHKLIMLRFVIDLHLSIFIKEEQRWARVGFLLDNNNNNNNDNSNNNSNDNNNKDQDKIATQKQSNQINNQRLRNVIIDELFYQDFNKIQLIKSQIENHVKIVTKNLYWRQRNNQWIRKQLSIINEKVIHCRYSSSITQSIKDENQSQEKNNFQKIITPQNFQLYISSLYQYLIIQLGNIPLYDLLKMLTQRWICDTYKQQQQRCFNLLNQIQQQGPPQQNEKLKNKEQQQKNNQNAEILTYQLVQSRKIHIEDQNKQLAFLQLLHQTKTRIRENVLSQSAVIPMDNFNNPCCNTFLYKFSQIQSNKYSSNPKNTHIIFITKESLIQQDNQNKQVSQQNQTILKSYEEPIKQATAALLNNNGGFIFIGFRKQGLYYNPQCPFVISENSTQTIKKNILQFISKEITLQTRKNEKQQISYKNIHVDFIPIFKRRNDAARLGNFANDGKSVWRISVRLDSQSKLKIYPIMETFYDLDQQNQTFNKLLDTQTKKDRIYIKLKEMLNYYEMPKSQRSSILKYNPYRLIPHNEPCQMPFQMNFVKQCKQIDNLKNKNEQSTDQSKKKNEKLPSNTQTIDTEEPKKNNDQNQEQKVEFKQINLIVLQNKNIKESCEKFFLEKKIQIKIEKLQNQSLKKLTKQTYIIHHHKKFDEINMQLNEFKKGFNSKKNISLISAQKSVSVDGCLDSKLLKGVQDMGQKFIQKFDDEKVSYVQQLKDNQSKSYLRAESKRAGIYLYFILSEFNLKPKMKNVPLALHNKLTSLDEVIKEKQSKEEKPTIKEPMNNNIQQYNNNKGQKNMNRNNNNNKNNQLQPYEYYKQNFIKSYEDCLKRYGDRNAAMNEFYNKLSSNINDWNSFWSYRINELPIFQQINQMIHNYYYYNQSQQNYYQSS